MKPLHFIWLSVLIGVAGCAQSIAMTSPQVPAPVKNCDVINEDFCFALPQGATVTLTIPVDFKLYEVVLANNQKIIVYYGSQPKYLEDVQPIFSEQTGQEKVSLYRHEVDGGQRVEAFYEKMREKFTIAVHVKSAYMPRDQAPFREFLAGMRKCNSSRKVLIECSPEPLFTKIVEKL